MVKLCSNSYPTENNEKYKEHFDMFPYELGAFQKHSIEALVEGQHSLVTAHTGSGKSTPFEFAAEYFTKRGKKIIYCSPIKSLSNQKFSDFTHKYPHISVGIITGDICVNKEASLLIVTTEILHNVLFGKQHQKQNQSNKESEPIKNTVLLSFDMDFDNELGCVVFDEFHYLNDPDRGHVWEDTVMMLPHHIQMLMLSATLDKPEKVANWIENRPTTHSINSFTAPKQVWIASTNHREVPLMHYSFITTTQSIFKIVKDKETEKEINGTINKLNMIQNEKGIFNDPEYHKIKKILTLLDQKQVYVKRAHVINQLCKYLVENSLLPAICFVLSRKQLEVCAHEVTVSLLEDDSKVGYNAKREAEQILRKLPNYREYLELSEYMQLVSLLEKGIGIHHAGMISIFREIVEIFLTKGYIKLLFCTETFALGVNFPIRSAIFTDVKKFDGGSGMRMLYAHEYTQMAGRSGRRGLDKVGTVIHLSNLFKNVELTEYRLMMHGKPQTLVSKFKISYNLLLNLIDCDGGSTNILQFCQRSMIQEDINTELAGYDDRILIAEKEHVRLEGCLQHLMTPREIVSRYIECSELVKVAVNKKRKELDKELTSYKDAYKNIESDKNTMIKYNVHLAEYTKMKNEMTNIDTYLSNNIGTVLQFLEKEGFIMKTDTGIMTLTLTGTIASHLRELHCLVFSQLLECGKLDLLSVTELVSAFSCFTNVSVVDELQAIRVPTSPLIKEITDKFHYYQDFELECRTNTGQDYNIHYDLMDYMGRWTEAETAEECKQILQLLEQEKGVFLGEFIKAILKINNVASELEKMAEHIGNISLLHKLKEIPAKTMKFVVTNQSLYI